MNAALSISLFVGHGILETHVALVAAHVAEWTSSPDPEVKGGLVGKTSEQVEAQIRLGRSVVLLDGDTVVGYATLYELCPGSWELGTVLVNPAYRGQGLAKQIYQGLAQLHQRLGGDVYSTTKCDLVVHLSAGIGLQRARYEQVPDNPHVGLCQQATCWRPHPEKPRECAGAAEHGGPCMLCMLRRPTAAAAPS